MTNLALSEKRSRRTFAILPAILVVSVVLRVVASFYLGNTVEVLPGTFDQISYHALALRVLDGHGFSFSSESWPLTAAGAPTAHWSFLYTLYLTAVYVVFGPNPLAARLIQAVIVGFLQPYVAFLLAREVFGRRAGLLAAGFTAIYVYFVYYAATLMTEPFYITAIVAALYLFLRLAAAPAQLEVRLALLLGVVLGGTILLRQLFLMVTPFLLIWLWAVWYAAERRRTVSQTARATAAGSVAFHNSRRAPWISTIVITSIIALMILPFTIYNYSRFDRFVLLNTNAGYAFFWANHPIYGNKFEGILPPEMGSYQDLIPVELRNLDQSALEEALLKLGVGFVFDDPIRYVRLSLSRIPVYFMFWPSAESSLVSNFSRVASFALFLPLMVGGLLYSLLNGEVRGRTISQASLLLLFMFIYTSIHLLSWALIRYRLPVDAILLIYAGLAAAVVGQAIAARRDQLATATP